MMLRWWLGAALQRPETIGALRHAAESYRRRADDQAELVRLLAPAVLMLLVGGSVTVFYALMLFVPYVSLLRSLS